MSSVSNQGVTGFFAQENNRSTSHQHDQGPIPIRDEFLPENPKFDILGPTPLIPLTPGVRVVALNEAAAQRLDEYVRECGTAEGDEWLWALINKLRISFTRQSPRAPLPMAGRQMRIGRVQMENPEG